MTQQELADAMDVSLPTIAAWISKGMPVKQKGGAGSAYELQLSHCFAWRQAQKANEDLRSEKVRQATQALRLALVGGSSGDTMAALDPKTRREIMAAQREHEMFERDRNQLMRRDDVRETFDVVFSLIRDQLNAAPDVIERKHALEPKLVHALIDICDDLVSGVKEAIDAFWRDRPVREATAQKRDLFDS
nr:terminase small subunit [Ensifer adhaerens]